jgi:two-component system, NtrC family, sensor kinase
MKAIRILENQTLRAKQTLIILLTSSLVLLIACTALVTYDTLAFRRGMVENLSVLADAIGDNCAAALDFDDPISAVETLAALRAKASIASACVYNRDGKLFASYQRDANAETEFPATTSLAGFTFTRHDLQLFRPIHPHGEWIGTIYVSSDLREFAVRLQRYVLIVGLVFLGSLLLAFLLSNRLQRLISGPILELATVARSVAVDKNYSVRAARRSDDELGQLVDGFNEMLVQIQMRDTALLTARHNLEERVRERTAELEVTHKTLLEISRAAGMAEIASNVLHNVGNVLNSVNISASLVTHRVKESRISSLGRIATLLTDHQADLGTFFSSDARAKRVPGYLTQLSSFLLAEQASTLEELESLRGNVEHIKEIVAMQQNYARVSGYEEITNVRELVEDSLRMDLGSLSRHDVELVRELEEVPPMVLEKHKALQILVNLIRNARHACTDSERADKCVTVRLTHSAGWMRISVSDNGVGILPEHLTRVFNHGFTTRKNGHGFGLHSGALAAKEMGGKLTAHSDGPGRGAMFTLELPVAGVST